MRARASAVAAFFGVCAVLLVLHAPWLRLPFFWDEAGYYLPAARDFYLHSLLVPSSTLPIGHVPLVMIYLGLVFRTFGYSAVAARAAMVMVAGGTVAAAYVLGRLLADAETAAWTALLLALSPMFFAQSTMLHLDLAAGLFTTLAMLFLLEERFGAFALAASLAVLSKETSVVLLPVAWAYEWWRRRRSDAGQGIAVARWAALAAPLLPLAAWTVYYHHATGFWTGNREYLSYNVYSTLSPGRIFFSILRRGYELLVSGFNWILTAGAAVGLWRGRRGPGRVMPATESDLPWRHFAFLAGGVTLVYLGLLSVVGGAILPRYLLPVIPCFYLACVTLVRKLPRGPARLILGAAAACFVWAWFINPPYPFPLEDNLAYADFVRLHQQASQFLEAQPGEPRILTAWPATDEIAKPYLGYVGRPLRAVPVQGFAADDFAAAAPDSFDLLYFYSRRWEPPGNWIERFPLWLRLQGRYYDYEPQTAAEAVAVRYHLRLLRQFERRGQWVKIYAR